MRLHIKETLYIYIYKLYIYIYIYITITKQNKQSGQEERSKNDYNLKTGILRLKNEPQGSSLCTSHC